MALKSDFANVLKNMAATGNSPENNSPMQSLNEKITAYERQITDLQKKLEVLETVVPVQDERYYLRQVLKEKDNEIEHLKAATDKPTGSVLQPPTHDFTSDLEIQKKLEQLQQENVELTKKVNEKEKELAKNKELLDYIHKELLKNKTREIAAQSLS
ncbi:MAG: hypothetical protein JWM28_901 [Chitinophagaceae bacterium]|nr:hypothetical protein [Chitinophagaceae bacterium]